MKKHEMKISYFTVNFEPAEGGGYDAAVQALPEIKIHGKTLKDTRALAKETLERYIEALQANEAAADHSDRLLEEVRAYMARNSQIGMP